MGRWRAAGSLLLNHTSRRRLQKTLFINSPCLSLEIDRSASYSSCCRPCRSPPQGGYSFLFRSFSAYPSRVPAYSSDNESGSHENFPMELKEDESDFGKIPVKAYFLCTRTGSEMQLLATCVLLLPILSGSALLTFTAFVLFPRDGSQIHRFGSIDLKNMQGEHLINVVPPTSRSTNYIVLRYYDYQPEITALGIKENVSCRYMVVFQYGSAVLINIEDHEVENYAIKEKPRLEDDMQGGPDYIVLKTLDTDSIRIIGSVLGQSIALDYFVSQVDGMVEEFAGINRGMEKTGTFTMDRTTLIKLVGKANSNLADVILKVGLFERSEIAWKDAKYSQIYEYLRDEYEVAQRFGSLDFKLKFVEATNCRLDLGPGDRANSQILHESVHAASCPITDQASCCRKRSRLFDRSVGIDAHPLCRGRFPRKLLRYLHRSLVVGGPVAQLRIADSIGPTPDPMRQDVIFLSQIVESLLVPSLPEIPARHSKEKSFLIAPEVWFDFPPIPLTFISGHIRHGGVPVNALPSIFDVIPQDKALGQPSIGPKLDIVALSDVPDNPFLDDRPALHNPFSKSRIALGSAARGLGGEAVVDERGFDQHQGASPFPSIRSKKTMNASRKSGTSIGERVGASRGAVVVPVAAGVINCLATRRQVLPPIPNLLPSVQDWEYIRMR
ncbi:unnamed protein product [Linum tenue]|uniref:DUF155 domain-containing protein n=3 Tax=Linum tenue TaxID=586396 RepID=A0AAV0NWS4_9ROSI|nr:unnamed protein product [Linum tenue]